MRRPTILFIACGLAVMGCSQQAPEPPPLEEASTSTWRTVETYDMTETQKAQHELCAAAVNALGSEMMGELVAALDSGGPDEAIGVCRSKAPAVSAKVAEQFNLKIGRTSHKLRNPENAPPPWAEELVAARVEEPAFLAGPGGEFGALLPIRLKAECQMCHGPAEMIDDAVKTTVAEHYPEDEAVGFAEGELRGWFWVEAPPGEAEPDAAET